eukprot:CAMPEP_0205801464 /NCGR_PEP_ID=MMETSP0205-20121125/3460_1 /ASSEMBLY_ACC=CAM_ASM_000278 /TAXON_ID=36767 /ORGANISM="Euplotes focardii, Strain TN1" /LENGTH=356 /DNA_ID=CAMNT_0053066253 /DNA_START=63 /DNA_END=1130 /DNA_ORIENTATION=+
MTQAGEIIRNGGLVSFPTETVYGLGANALDIEAATSIFATKERPMTDPLIVHIAKKEDAYELINPDDNILEIFNMLGDRFWPGPLTCVVQANKDKISPIITADTGYVGIRCPNNPVALKLIKEAGRPIAAPSANKFGHVSPTKAQHVLYDFKNDGVFILDGGPCNFGIESTVVKIYHQETSTPEEPHINFLILRRGGISELEFRNVISECKLINNKTKLTVECVEKKHFTEESHKMEAPGQFLRHYAPNLPSYMLSNKKLSEDSESKILNLSKCVFLDFNSENIKLKELVSLYLDLSEKGDYTEAIKRVYDYLRISETQEEGEMVIIADLFNPSSSSESSHPEHSSALFDRLFRSV